MSFELPKPKAVTPVPNVRHREFDKCGAILAGGQIWTYEANSTTPKITYKDPYGITPNTNPIILDANGEADIFLNGTYRFVVKDKKGVVQKDVPRIGSWYSGDLDDQLKNVNDLLETSAQQLMQPLSDAINAALAAGAGANGWTDKLVAMTGGGTLDVFAENLAVISPKTQDITQELKNAIASNMSEYTLPEGDFTVSETIAVNSTFVLKSNKATITGNNQPLFNTTASIELHNIKLVGFSDIVAISNGQEIKKIGFYNCDLSQCESVLTWIDTTRNAYLHRLDMLMCDVTEMSKHVINCEARIRDIYFGGNTLTNNVRYLLRRLFGDTNERYCENVYIYKNIVRGLTNGTFTGSSAVARCWQVAAERIFLLNNHYENVTTTDIGAANCTIAYTDAKYLLVSGNTHKNCGAESSSGYLYHDKSSGGRSISNKYLTNTFEQDDTQGYNQGVIQSVALSSEFISNTFDGVRGICSYLGWDKARNITYAFNKHLNLKGVCAVRFYGDLETINHFGNIYDGITNDKDAIDSGRQGVWFVDILKSSADTAPKSFKSFGNTYKNINYTGAATSPIKAAIVIGSNESMDKFSVADFFHDMQVGVQFRIAAQMQTFVLDKSEFYNVASPYQFQAGASYKPLNFVLGDNLGLKTKARGKVTFAENQTSITVQHGLFGASSSNLWVQISGTELETFRVAGTLAASFDIRRAAAATTPSVFWEAEVL